jgi:hypothetical protein
MPFICRSCGAGALSRKIYKHSAPPALPHKRIRQQNLAACGVPFMVRGRSPARWKHAYPGAFHRFSASAPGNYHSCCFHLQNNEREIIVLRRACAPGVRSPHDFIADFINRQSPGRHQGRPDPLLAELFSFHVHRLR